MFCSTKSFRLHRLPLENKKDKIAFFIEPSICWNSLRQTERNQIFALRCPTKRKEHAPHKKRTSPIARRKYGQKWPKKISSIERRTMISCRKFRKHQNVRIRSCESRKSALLSGRFKCEKNTSSASMRKVSRKSEIQIIKMYAYIRCESRKLVILPRRLKRKEDTSSASRFNYTKKPAHAITDYSSTIQNFASRKLTCTPALEN